MKRTMGLLCGLLAALTLSPAMAFAQEANPQECVSDVEAGADLFPAKVAPQYSESWDISYHETYKVVTVRNSLVEGSTEYTYVLVQCGTPAPDLTGDLESATLVEVPVRRVTFAATDFYPLLALDRLETLVAWDVNRLAVDSPFTRRVVQAGNTVPIGDLDGGSFDMEATLNAELDVAFVWLEYGEFAQQGEDLGLLVVYSPANYEATALAAAETIEFTAAFYNLEAEANQFMVELEANMAATAEAVSEVALSGTFAHVSVASDEFMRVHTDAEPSAGLIESLGPANIFGDIPLAGMGTMGNVDFETALARIEEDTTVFIIESRDQVLAEMGREPRYASLPPFANPTGQVWVEVDPQTLDIDCPAMLHFRPDLELRDYAIALAPELFPGEQAACYVPLGELP